MIPSSQAFNTVVNQTSRTWLAHVYACEETTLSGGTDLGTSNVVAFTLKRGLCGDSFVPGGVFIPSATVQIQDNGLTTAQREALMEAYALRIELWLFDDEPVQAIPFNQLVVINRKKQSDLWTLECSGRLSQVLDTTYTSSLTYPALLPDVITELDNWFYTNWGLRLEVIPDDGAGDEATIDKSLSGLTIKEALEVVASLMRSWVTQANTGAPVIARAGWGDLVDVPANRSITPPEYGDWYEVTGVECIVQEAQESPDGTIIPAVTYSDSQSPNIIMENSYMTQSMWDAYAGIFDAVAFEPATVEMTLGDPRIDPWDILNVYDLEGTVHTVPCLNVTHHYNGGLSTTVTAPVPTAGESTVTIIGPVERAVKTLRRQVNALQVAGTNAQYFWHNQDGQDVSTGTYITEVPESTFRADPANGGGNTLIRSNGLALRNGLTELASFTANGVQIGQDNATNIRIAPNGLILSNDAQAIVLNVSTDGGTKSSQKTIAARSLELGTPTSSWGPKAQYANGSISTEYDLSDAPAGVTIGLGSPAEPTVTLQGFGYVEDVTTSLEQSQSGGSSNPSRWWASAWGQRAATITQGVSSTNTISVEVALTNGGSVSGTQNINLTYKYVASTGILTVTMSVQEPFDNMTRVAYARVDLPTISYTASIAAPAYLLGTSRDGLGSFSLASGEDVYASSANQVALGKYNVQDQADDYAFILGNGTDDANRSNALTVDWAGAVVAAGPITAQGHSSAIGTIESVSATVSVSSGTSWGRKADTALQVDPGTWLVIASASCPGSTTGDRALGITYGSATGNLVQSRTTMRANAGSGIAAMQTTMVVATNTAARTYSIEYWQNSNAAKSVDFRLTAVRLA